MYSKKQTCTKLSEIKLIQITGYVYSDHCQYHINCMECQFSLHRLLVTNRNSYQQFCFLIYIYKFIKVCLREWIRFKKEGEINLPLPSITELTVIYL